MRRLVEFDAAGQRRLRCFADLKGRIPEPGDTPGAFCWVHNNFDPNDPDVGWERDRWRKFARAYWAVRCQDAAQAIQRVEKTAPEALPWEDVV